MDEYELTQHYAKWPQDLGLVKELGVSHARYGIPWHRIQPSPNEWRWESADGPLERLLASGVDPIVDLVHYGLPPWIESAYLDQSFPQRMAEYAARTAERFKGRIHLWTPLNEPRITAWYCGKLGWWPPFQRGWSGFLRVIAGVCKGIVHTVRALRKVDAENCCAHVDATDLYESNDPGLGGEVRRRQEIVFLALDLVSGRVNERHYLWEWLLQNGMPGRDLDWFQGNAIELDLIGINLYPLFSRKVLKRSPHLRIQMPYASGDLVERVAAAYFHRHQTPLFVAETASLGSIKKRSQWLVDSVASVRRAREKGLPVMGYTWWPLFALVTWAYRQGKHPAAYYLKQMGLWNLVPAPSPDSISGEIDLKRVRTTLVDEFQRLASAGSSPVGRVHRAEGEDRGGHKTAEWTTLAGPYVEGN